MINRIKQLKITGGIIWLLELIQGKDYLEPKLSYLRTLKYGTVGREVAEMLDNKNYRLIPKFENHDLKHIVLEYEMTMKDEIRMQAYLIGNGKFYFSLFNIFFFRDILSNNLERFAKRISNRKSFKINPIMLICTTIARKFFPCPQSITQHKFISD